AGKDVSWDSHTRVVYIADAEQQIRHVLDKYFAYMNHEDRVGMLSVVTPQSSIREQLNEQMDELFSNYDLRIEAQYRIVERNDTQADVDVQARTTGQSGAEYEDHTTMSRYRVV